MRPWLIEVNTNPCLEESSQLLKQLVPRMLNDAFKLTLDVIYPPIKNFSQNKSAEREREAEVALTTPTEILQEPLSN